MNNDTARNRTAPRSPSRKRGSGGSSPDLTFAYAFKSFVGFLEGTEKSLHTIKSYQSDLGTFQKFLNGKLHSKKRISITEVQLSDLERYHSYLKHLGLKANTRRRKLLTVRRFFRYLIKRNKLSTDVSQKLPTPYKVERVPSTISIDKFITSIRGLPTLSELETRNRLVLWTLAETGCLVSEVTSLRFEHWKSVQRPTHPFVISFESKLPRDVPVSEELFQEIQLLHKKYSQRKSLFLGFNKFGPLGGSISSRGVELLVKAHSQRLGYSRLTPRLIRHSAVVSWHSKGLTQSEIKQRLGLKTDYAFRVYEPLFKKSQKSNEKPKSNS